MASRATRACSAGQGDVYWCPLPQLQRAEGYDSRVPRRLEMAGERQSWTERRVVVRSMRQAQAAERALRARVATAMAQIEALNHRGRGQQRFDEVSAFRQAVVTMVQRSGVEECFWLRESQPTTPRAVRAYRARPARVEEDRSATVEVRADEGALAGAVRRLGWQVYGSNQAAEQWSLAQAVLASRSAYLVERRVGRLTGRPLSLTPMDVQRDDHATGLRRLVSIALRVLTLLECVVRRRLTAEGTQLHGL